LLLGALCFLLFATIRKTLIHDELLGTVAVSCGAATATRTRRSGSPG
jgi:hypothetical protein